MDLPIAAHNIEVKLNTIRKHIQYAIDDLPVGSEPDTTHILEKLLDRMDVGTNDPESVVPNRISGDLSLVEELNYLKNLRLTKRRVHNV